MVPAVEGSSTDEPDLPGDEPPGPGGLTGLLRAGPPAATIVPPPTNPDGDAATVSPNRFLVGLRTLLRKVRRLRHGWSPESDRHYHDEVFARQEHDPFRFGYPGHVTIRRFADLVEPRVADCRRVADLGCGPGEITCLLARRRPGIAFLGIDHSRSAIERARENARRLELENLEFRTGDVARWRAEEADAVLMLDSFHHLEDGRSFVDRLREEVPRFVLIEPRGDWKGSWARDLDLDWILSEFGKIRARLEFETGLGPADDRRAREGRARDGGVPEQGRGAVENRYALDDLVDIFDGYGLTVRGTVAGIDRYPAGETGDGPMQETFGRLLYELFSEIDRRLRERDLDLCGKHWVVVAERGARHRLRPVPVRGPAGRSGAPPGAAGPGAPVDPEQTRVAGAYDVDYLEIDVPACLRAGETATATIRFRNDGWRTWSSDDPAGAFNLSYHWLDPAGDEVVFDGLRTPLERPLGPGEVLEQPLRIVAPDAPGRYRLAVDLVHEGHTWFSEAGNPALEVAIRVRPAPGRA